MSRNSKILEIIRACETVESELIFHAERIERDVEADTKSEHRHLANLAREYRNSARAVGILKRYQKGRLRRSGRTSHAALTKAYLDE